jgi:mannose-1-phosphate guanylyltransferase/mannose-6-phosphate isomerase
MQIYPVIMCGGSGTRLWPASRPGSPKQFIPLVGGYSTFQQAALRVNGVSDARAITVVGGVRHQAAISRQLREIGVSAQVLLEPQARDSAPAMAAAAAWIIGQDPDGVAVVVAADHHVPDAEAFQAAIAQAALGAEQGWIVTLGVRPTYPSPAYGYIKSGGSLGSVLAVEAFVEKPDEAVAARYLRAGYLWNSGNFVVRAATLIEALKAHAPGVAEAAQAAIETGVEVAPSVLTLGAPFAGAPKISIDYAVMEKTDRAAVLPVDFAWSDLGAWDAVRTAAPLDAAGNAVEGDVVLEGAENTLVRAAPGMVVAALGVRNLAIVAEPDAVLVCDLDHSQGVKRIVDRLAAASKPQVDRPASAGIDGPADLPAFAAAYDHWLSTQALPVWWALGADHARGGFEESLELDGRATGAPRHAKYQARQVFAYAVGGRLGWRGPWREAADQGLSYLDDRYRLPSGLYRPLVAADGTPLDDNPVLYDQAFVLLAMAAVHAVRPERGGLPSAALGLLEAIDRAFVHPAGGYREVGAQPFWANPHMHLLEAALAWGEAGGGAVWDDLAGRIGRLALERFIDPTGGFLREYFDAEWRPAASAAGRVVEPGHQFEWAWLLDRWGERAGDANARQAARRLFAAGVRGVDEARDVAMDELDDDFAVVRATARLWPQTERLKAAIRFTRATPPDQSAGYLADALSAARGLWRYLETPTPGLWRDRQLVDGRFIEEPASATSLYHLIGAIRELSAYMV